MIGLTNLTLWSNLISNHLDSPLLFQVKQRKVLLSPIIIITDSHTIIKGLKVKRFVLWLAFASHLCKPNHQKSTRYFHLETLRSAIFLMSFLTLAMIHSRLKFKIPFIFHFLSYVFQSFRLILFFYFYFDVIACIANL